MIRLAKISVFVFLLLLVFFVFEYISARKNTITTVEAQSNIVGKDITGSACTPNVPNCTTTVSPGGSIQAAINAASSGAVICVEAGTYVGKIKLNKPNITLISKTAVKPIIDGTGAGVTTYEGLVDISAPNVKFINFKVQKSSGRCMRIYATRPGSVENTLLDSVYLSDCYGDGLVVFGANNDGQNAGSSAGTVIQNFTVEYDYSTCLNGANDVTIKNSIIRYGRGGAGGSSNIAGEILMVDCNWERSTGTVIENNFIYNTQHALTYIHATSNLTFKNNAVFQTSGGNFGDRATWGGLWIQGQETESYDRGGAYVPSNITIENNLFWGQMMNTMVFGTWAPGTNINNFHVRNNTFYSWHALRAQDQRFADDVRGFYFSSKQEYGGSIVGYSTFTNTDFINNIFYVPNTRTMSHIDTANGAIPPGMTFSGNAWNKKPTVAGFGNDIDNFTPQFAGVSDRSANPQTYTELMNEARKLKITNSDKGADVDAMLASMGQCAPGGSGSTPLPTQPTTPTKYTKSRTNSNTNTTCFYGR